MKRMQVDMDQYDLSLWDMLLCPMYDTVNAGPKLGSLSFTYLAISPFVYSKGILERGDHVPVRVKLA